VEGRLYIASNTGAIYRFDPTGAAWVRIPDALTGAQGSWPGIRSIGRCGDNLVIGRMHAIWMRPLSQTVGIQPRGLLPSSGLTLNAGPSGSIAHFSLSAPGPIDFRMWDASGRLSAVLVSGMMPAGEHAVLIPRASQEGVRFLMLRAGGRTFTLRFVGY